MVEKKGIYTKIVIVMLSILLLGSFWLTMRTASDSVSMVVNPEVVKEGEPIWITFKLNNPSAESLTIDYQFFADGRLITGGASTIAPESSETHQLTYENALQIGEQSNFVVRTQSELGNHENIVSLPSYPPHIWSSFVSFAAISQTMMSQMTSMAYFESTLGSDMGFNIGVLITIVLIVLLIFMELTQSQIQRNSVTVMGRLRLRFNTVTWILFIIFMGIVYTRVAMILSGV
jgi:hypothetical protein